MATLTARRRPLGAFERNHLGARAGALSQCGAKGDRAAVLFQKIGECFIRQLLGVCAFDEIDESLPNRGLPIAIRFHGARLWQQFAR